MKKILLILSIFFFIKSDLLAQASDSVYFKNGVTFNLEALYLKDIMLSYSHRIAKGIYFESMVAYKIKPIWKTFALTELLFYLWHFVDPFSYYGRFQMRTGVKFYPKNKRFYIEPMILGSYGNFNHGYVFRPIDTDNWFYDVYRKKKELEGMIKIGWTEQVKHKFRDGYIGLGYRKIWVNDMVYSDHYRDTQMNKLYNTDNPNNVYPYFVKDSFSRITVHIGLQLGYCR